MKKSRLYEIILIIVGILTYSMGTCMYLIEYWNLKNIGIFSIIIGIAQIALFIIKHNKNKVQKQKEHSIKEKIFLIAGSAGFIIFAIGLIIMFATKFFVLGVIIGIIGLAIDILNYPIYNYKETLNKINSTIKNPKTYKNLITFIGCSLIAMGFPMTAVEEWNMVMPGTILGLIGVGIIVLVFYFNDKKEKKKEQYVIDLRDIFSFVIGAIGVFLISFGLIKTTELVSRIDLLVGLAFEYIGFLLCVLIIPINIYLKRNEIYNKTLVINIHDKKHTYSVRNLWLMFVIYGFLGWCVEFIVCGAYKGEFINRGFLHITLLPVWGLGGIIVTLIFRKSQRLVFTKSTIYLSFLEYITSILLEYIFNNKWWDYTDKPFNLNGRICLLNCLAFGIFGLIFSKYVSPLINKKLNDSNEKILNAVSIILVIVFCTDLIFSFFNPNVGVGITS